MRGTSVDEQEEGPGAMGMVVLGRMLVRTENGGLFSDTHEPI